MLLRDANFSGGNACLRCFLWVQGRAWYPFLPFECPPPPPPPVTLIATVSTSTSCCGNNFHAMGWQFYTDILQGVDIPAGKKLCEKGDFQKIVQEDIFVAIWWETHIYVEPGLLVKSQFSGSQVLSYSNFAGIHLKTKVNKSGLIRELTLKDFLSFPGQKLTLCYETWLSHPGSQCIHSFIHSFIYFYLLIY